jgi:hypothetical protein
MDGLLSTLRLAHKVAGDVMKFICSSGELVHVMWRLEFCGFDGGSLISVKQ